MKLKAINNNSNSIMYSADAPKPCTLCVCDVHPVVGRICRLRNVTVVISIAKEAALLSGKVVCISLTCSVSLN